jgi:hypothetical protein
MKYYLHQTNQGLLLNQSPRSTKSGTIFNSIGAVDTWQRALSNITDTEIEVIKTY